MAHLAKLLAAHLAAARCAAAVRACVAQRAALARALMVGQPDARVLAAACTLQAAGLAARVLHHLALAWTLMTSWPAAWVAQALHG